MRKGIVKISSALLVSGMTLPSRWTLESIHMNNGDRWAIAVIQGSEFPNVLEGEKPKECRITCHKESFWFEVEEIIRKEDMKGE